MLAEVDITKVQRTIKATVPSASGCQREVWFMGADVVVKKEYSCYSGANAMEFAAANRMRADEPIPFSGMAGTLRVPAMVMLTDDIIAAERAPGEHLYLDMDCRMRHDDGATCDEACAIFQEVRAIADRYGVTDVHEENFLWDASTRTAWLVDLGM